jgi:hypothetical protein
MPIAAAKQAFHHRLCAVRRDCWRVSATFSLQAGTREPLSIALWEGVGSRDALLLFTFYYARRHKISWLNLGDNSS